MESQPTLPRSIWTFNGVFDPRKAYRRYMEQVALVADDGDESRTDLTVQPLEGQLVSAAFGFSDDHSVGITPISAVLEDTDIKPPSLLITTIWRDAAVQHDTVEFIIGPVIQNSEELPNPHNVEASIFDTFTSPELEGLIFDPYGIAMYWSGEKGFAKSYTDAQPHLVVYEQTGPQGLLFHQALVHENQALLVLQIWETFEAYESNLQKFKQALRWHNLPQPSSVFEVQPLGLAVAKPGHHY